MNKVRLFLDTEFTDLRQDCELISIGIVASIDGYEDNPCFYAESIDYSEDKCSDFVRTDVLPHLILGDKPQAVVTNTGNFSSYAILGTEEDITMHLINWLHELLGQTPDNVWQYGEDEPIEIWSDVLNYDWTLFRHLFENDGGLPNYIYYIPFDLSTAFRVNGINPDISREDYARMHHSDEVDMIARKKHNSLYDAMIIYYCYDELM